MDRVIQKLIELLEEHVKYPRCIKSIYNGRVKQIPNANFPAIIVKGISMNSRTLDTARGL